MVLYAQRDSAVGKAGGETERDFTWVKPFVAGTFREPAERLPFLPALRNPQTGLWVSARPYRFGRNKKAAAWDLSSPRSLRVLPGHTDTHALPRFPCRQQACPSPAVGSDGVSGKGNALFFCCFFSRLCQKAQLALFFSAPDPRFTLHFVSHGMSPGDTGASDCHQSRNRQHPVLSKWCANHSLCG